MAHVIREIVYDNRRGTFAVQAFEHNARKNGGSRRAAFSKVETVRSEDELARDLGNSLIRGGGRERSVGRRRRELHEGYLAKERRVSVRIRRTIIRMVEPVVGTQTNLERHTLGDCKILLYAQVAAQESWTTKCVTPDITHKVRAGLHKIRRRKTRSQHTGSPVAEVPLSEGRKRLRKDGCTK
jgi:hypothetical protein